MHNIMVYGSLRQPCYNFTRCGLDKKAKAMGTCRVKGYFMGKEGGLPYPFIAPTIRLDDPREITVEMYQVDDKLFAQLDRMEAGAGYVKDEIQLHMDDPKDIWTIWVIEQPPPFGQYTEIESGDWVEYVKRTGGLL